MINQDRVRDMTHMAVLEAGIGEKELHISAFRRADYVLLSLVKGAVSGTVCFGSFFLIWFCGKWDTLNQYFADANFSGFLGKWLIGYVIFLAAYLFLCGFVAAWRHRNCTRRKKKYQFWLHRLIKTYSSEKSD